MGDLYPTIEEAKTLLEWAEELNPGPWGDHSRYAALACQKIAARCEGLDQDKAYVYGLLHDIGRYIGMVHQRHGLEGYLLCEENGWQELARICITHSFVVQDAQKGVGNWDIPLEHEQLMWEVIESSVHNDYDRLVQLADSLAMADGFCVLEQRFVDVAMRYGVYDYTVERWKKVFEIKDYFEKLMGENLYGVLGKVKIR
ncbi:MAG: HD domain-containing protein [Turicibacter sp.]|nr:HD domain-containing protein [Turicibacter sp.]